MFAFNERFTIMKLFFEIALVGYVTYSVLGAPVVDLVRADIDRKLAR